MDQNKKKNIAVLVAVTFLVLALFDGWPYGFFMLLRFAVFASSAYVAWLAYGAQKKKWVWIFAFFAVLFNPFILIRFNREWWRFIDIITGILMIISVFALKLTKKDKND